ncbi:TetR/AcrR family transcriptional regulator [Lentzea sp. HUAS12]|uniref:TetR/AcrR family transcriptional regulator n=1 Tax=Lentzea sp. HUAS12 TaxID=2951806 RepID=UPI00209DEB54|nr:TetR/AcrR family transcriptional regulator [Lentzea sp. HUAS12]USX55306.1 TetR/AcrR family transcriptional regulator [Lentzea sp. HUAS12]
MARWDPGTEDRLRRAALELFVEHGYDNVTVTQIAERAGITRRSYFRYFPDKREVLFAGSEQLPPTIMEAVRNSEEDSAPAIALDAARRVGILLVDRAGRGVERRAVIASSPELQERERTKGAAITAALADALAERGVAEPGLVARLVSVCLQEAFERYLDTGEDFGACFDAAVASVRSAADLFPAPLRP